MRPIILAIWCILWHKLSRNSDCTWNQVLESYCLNVLAQLYDDISTHGAKLHTFKSYSFDIKSTTLSLLLADSMNAWTAEPNLTAWILNRKYQWGGSSASKKEHQHLWAVTHSEGHIELISSDMLRSRFTLSYLDSKTVSQIIAIYAHHHAQLDMS